MISEIRIVDIRNVLTLLISGNRFADIRNSNSCYQQWNYWYQ